MIPQSLQECQHCTSVIYYILNRCYFFIITQIQRLTTMFYLDLSNQHNKRSRKGLLIYDAAALQSDPHRWRHISLWSPQALTIFTAPVIKDLNTQERRSWLKHERKGKPLRVHNVLGRLTRHPNWLRRLPDKAVPFSSSCCENRWKPPSLFESVTCDVLNDAVWGCPQWDNFNFLHSSEGTGRRWVFLEWTDKEAHCWVRIIAIKLLLSTSPPPCQVTAAAWK